jgi:hypothetical protein
MFSSLHNVIKSFKENDTLFSFSDSVISLKLIQLSLQIISPSSLITSLQNAELFKST